MEVELDQIGGWEITITIFFSGGPVISRLNESNRPECTAQAIQRTAQRHSWIRLPPRYSTYFETRCWILDKSVRNLGVDDKSAVQTATKLGSMERRGGTLDPSQLILVAEFWARRGLEELVFLESTWKAPQLDCEVEYLEEIERCHHMTIETHY